MTPATPDDIERAAQLMQDTIVSSEKVRDGLRDEEAVPFVEWGLARARQLAARLATAGQLARHFGASKVVGLAGSAEKSRWLVNDCGFDAALDYRDPALDLALRAALPDGIDILFDNVGNAMIDRMLPQMKMRGRIAISGQVADYNTPPDQVPGIRQTREFIARRLRMEGMVVFDDLPMFAGAQSEVAGLLKDGSLQTREVIGEGIESLPGLFAGLFSSDGFGRRLARI